MSTKVQSHSHSITISNTSNAIKPIVTKFHIGPPGVEEVKNMWDVHKILFMTSYAVINHKDRTSDSENI